jgi:hypothetical protein
MRLNERGAVNMSNDTNYERKAITTQIRATSRASVKVSESYYTVEYSEDRTIPDIDCVNIEEERRILWDDVNTEVDNQIEDILRSFKK